jgi:hypothetical protein
LTDDEVLQDIRELGALGLLLVTTRRILHVPLEWIAP